MTGTRTVFKALTVRARDDSMTIDRHRRCKKSGRLAKDEFKLTSCAAVGRASVEYLPGERASAPDWLAEQEYHLIAFSNLQAAVEFIREQTSEASMVVFEAEADGVVELPRRCFVNRVASGTLKGTGDPWPRGTVMARGITPGCCVWSEFECAPLGITVQREVSGWVM